MVLGIMYMGFNISKLRSGDFKLRSDDVRLLEEDPWEGVRH